MSHCLFSNFEDFSLVQDITQTSQLHTQICVCCLEKNNSLVYLGNCSHTDFLKDLVVPDLKPYDQVVCYQCHSVLRKIKQFNLQVRESFRILSSEPFNISELYSKPSRLITKKVVDLQIPENDTYPRTQTAMETVKHDNVVPEEKRLDTKMKNIQTALDIIDSNNSMPFIGFLNEINKLKDDMLGAPTSGSLDVENVGIAPSLGACVKTETADILTSCSTDVLDTAVSNSPILKHSETTPSVDAVVKPYTALGSIRVDTQPSAKQKNPIRKVKLTTKQLMRERYILTWSKVYLKCPYKCKNCIQGFNYKENLDDHNSRKHNVTVGSICEICMQVHPEAAMALHMQRHFYRYMCVECLKKFVSRDDAVYHYAKQHVMRYKCGMCGYVVEDLKKMRLHRIKRHRFLCERCGVVFATSRRLRWHVVVKHNNTTLDSSQDSSSSVTFPQQLESIQSYCIKCDVNFKPTHACAEEMPEIDPMVQDNMPFNLDNWDHLLT